MPVHRRVTPNIKFTGTHLYTWVERGTMNTTQCPRPGLESGPIVPEASALTMRPPYLPQLCLSSQLVSLIRRVHFLLCLSKVPGYETVYCFQCCHFITKPWLPLLVLTIQYVLICSFKLTGCDNFTQCEDSCWNYAVNISVILVSIIRHFPFNQNFQKFWSKTEWNSSVQLLKF